MTKTIDHDLQVLPKWAQHLIKRQRKTITALENWIRKQDDGGPTRIAVNETLYGAREAEFWASNDSRVKFWLPDPEEGRPRSRWAEARLSGGRLRIMASGFLTVHPESHSLVEIDTEGH